MISRYFSWGVFGIALMAMALIHYVRRQPSFYWLYLIIFLGPLGALIYLAIEWLPELFDPGAFRFLERGRRVREVEAAIRQNPSAGNYEELGLLRLDQGDWAGARAADDGGPADGGPADGGANEGPSLVDQPNASGWLVRQVAGSVATDRFWSILLNPATFAP